MDGEVMVKGWWQLQTEARSIVSAMMHAAGQSSVLQLSGRLDMCLLST
jgi:hypothetical protein